MVQWKQLMSRLVRSGEAWLGTPTRPCAYCSCPVKSYAVPSLNVCNRCYSRIPWIETILCIKCGRAERCPDCVRWGAASLQLSRSAVRYDAEMKDWLAAYKYRKNERLSDLFATMLYTTYKRHEWDFTRSGAPHVVTYVPVSEARLYDRGFNQAAQLAARLGERLNVPVVPLLRRNRDTFKQSGKSRSERLNDLKGVFSPEPSSINLLLKKSLDSPINIVIVDDVYTTGSTLHYCADTLCSQLEANVYGLTWAR